MAVLRYPWYPWYPCISVWWVPLVPLVPLYFSGTPFGHLCATRARTFRRFVSKWAKRHDGDDGRGLEKDLDDPSDDDKGDCGFDTEQSYVLILHKDRNTGSSVTWLLHPISGPLSAREGDIAVEFRGAGLSRWRWLQHCIGSLHRQTSDKHEIFSPGQAEKKIKFWLHVCWMKLLK